MQIWQYVRVSKAPEYDVVCPIGKSHGVEKLLRRRGLRNTDSCQGLIEILSSLNLDCVIDWILVITIANDGTASLLPPR
jgi:hypothetical protein